MKIVMYSTGACPFCMMARRLLETKGVDYEEIRVDKQAGGRQEMQRVSGRHTVPQIFIGERHVGGFDELQALERAGELDPLLADVPRARAADGHN
ncbi:MAG TPA: glutaredoxin 3 [Gammaproteobacteria bacterium]|nr:glutaredoxin 3 [Gammaproteobacteria bacterium]